MTVSLQPFLSAIAADDPAGSANEARLGVHALRASACALFSSDQVEPVDVDGLRASVDDLPPDNPFRGRLGAIVAAVAERDAVRICRALAGYADALQEERPHSAMALAVYETALAGCAEDAVPAERLQWLAAAAKTATRAARRERAEWLIEELHRAAAAARAPEYTLLALHSEAELQMSIGNLPRAEQAARAALRISREGESRERETVSLFLLGVILGRRGKHRRATQLLFSAFKLAPTARLENAALLALGSGLAELCSPEAALQSQELLLARELPGFQRSVALMNAIEFSARSGDLERFHRYRAQLRATDLAPHALCMLFVAEATGWERFGDAGRAAQSLRDGLALARAHDFAQLMFEMEAQLEGLASERGTRAPTKRPSVTLRRIEAELEIRWAAATAP